MTKTIFRCAVLADIHGNLQGLDAILADIERQQPDVIVCAGDMIGCHFPGSENVLQRLQQDGIQVVKGNQEEYFVSYHDPAGDPELKTGVHFWPMHFFARQMSLSAIGYLKTLPMTLTFPGHNAQDVLICHGSLSHTRRSYANGINPEMARELSQCKAAVIACGHLHRQWQMRWQDKLLVMASSAGLPLRGIPDQVEYLLLDYVNEAWQFCYKILNYDFQSALQSLLDSGFLEGSGPMGWIILDEVLSEVDRLMPFFESNPRLPDAHDQPGWEKCIRDYLVKIGRWEAVKEYIP